MNFKHGHRRSADADGHESLTYVSWKSMLQRCLNPNCKDYQRYGARGIRVCKRWLLFENFLEDMGLRPSAKHTLDRIGNARVYSKATCRWATPQEQQRNKSNNLLIRVQSHSISAAEAAETYGIPYDALWRRKKRGWTDYEAITIPLNVRRDTFFGYR